MTKHIARFALAGAAVAAFAVPAAPAHADHCVNMGTTPVECLLEANGIHSGCIRRGTYINICTST